MFSFATLAFLLSIESAPPPPPEIVLPYVEEGEFSPGDFEWMRGAFPEADEPQKRSYEAIQAWLTRCSEEARSMALAELTELGVEAAQLSASAISHPFCDQVAIQPRLEIYEDFDDFSENLTTTRPIFEALVETTELAEKIAGPTTTSLADELLHRPMAGQI